MGDQEQPPDLDWIEACALDIAEEAWDILSEVLHEMDLMHDPQVISPYPRGTDDLKWGMDYHDRCAANRTEVAKMLERRRVLRTAEPFHERESYHRSDRRRGLRITGDEAVVRRAHALLKDRVRRRLVARNPRKPPAQAPSPDQWPKTIQEAPPPTSPTPPTKEIAGSDSFKQGSRKGTGGRGRRWAMGVVILVALAIAAYLLKL